MHATLSGARAREGAEALEASRGDELAAAVLRLHADRVETAERERRVLGRFTRAHPAVPIIDVPAMSTDVHDLDGLAQASVRDRALGMSGELLLHPSNVAIVNQTYSPSPEQVAFYKGMIAALDKAQSEGRASCVYDGEHIDIAHVKTARDIIALAESLAA